MPTRKRAPSASHEAFDQIHEVVPGVRKRPLPTPEALRIQRCAITACPGREAAARTSILRRRLAASPLNCGAPSPPGHPSAPGVCSSTCGLRSGTFSNSAATPRPRGPRATGRSPMLRRAPRLGTEASRPSAPTGKRWNSSWPTPRLTCIPKSRTERVRRFCVRCCWWQTITPIIWDKSCCCADCWGRGRSKVADHWQVALPVLRSRPGSASWSAKTRRSAPILHRCWPETETNLVSPRIVL